MTHAYQETYLNSAMSLLGDAFDFAVNHCGISGAEFVKIFVNSAACRHIERGEAKYLLGKSGIEVVCESVLEITGKTVDVEFEPSFYRSVEYWCGWAVGYCQWFLNRQFAEIFKAVSFDEFVALYPTLHEADISKCVDVVAEKLKRAFPDINLKRIRTAYGVSQSELAKMSGVSLRSIQMYEQHQKDINKAQADTLHALAKVLGCAIEDLME